MFDAMYRPLPPDSPAVAPRKRWRPARAMAFAVAALTCAAAATTHAASAPARTGESVPVETYKAQSTVLSIDTEVGDDGVAEEIFQNNFVSARSVATFARNGQPVGAVDQAKFEAASGGSERFTARYLRGEELFDDTIGALGGKGPSRASRGERSKPKALLTFWAAPGTAEDAGSESAGVEAAAAAAVAAATGSGPGSVLIPLPAAAWSALSVMGGVGALAGARRIRRRLR